MEYLSRDSGFTFEIATGTIFYSKTDTPYRRLRIVPDISDTSGIKVRFLLQYQDYPYQMEPVPQDTLLGTLHWSGAVSINKATQVADIEYFYFLGVPIISRQLVKPFALQASKERENGYFQSLEFCTGLVDHSTEAVKLAARGEASPLFGFHLRPEDLQDHRSIPWLIDSLAKAKICIKRLEAMDFALFAPFEEIEFDVLHPYVPEVKTPRRMGFLDRYADEMGYEDVRLLSEVA